jgi:hypothetical protein
MRANVQALDGDWNRVTGAEPCPVCGGPTECRLHSDESFACCVRQPSDWRLENGGWLHRVNERTRAKRTSEVRLVQPLNEVQGALRTPGVAS